MKTTKFQKPNLTPKERQIQLFEAVANGDREKLKFLGPTKKEINNLYHIKQMDGSFQDIPMLFTAIINKQKSLILELLLTYKADPNIEFILKKNKINPFLTLILFRNSDIDPASIINFYDPMIIFMLRNKNKANREILKFIPHGVLHYFNFLCHNYCRLTFNEISDEFLKFTVEIPSIINAPLLKRTENPLEMLAKEKAPLEIINLFLEYGANEKNIDFSYLNTKNDIIDLMKKAIKNNHVLLLALLANNFSLTNTKKNSLISYADSLGNEGINSLKLLLLIYEDKLNLIFYYLIKYLIAIEKKEIVNQSNRKTFEENITTVKHEINTISQQLITPLYHVISSVNDVSLVKFMLEQGADPNGGEVRKPILAACQENYSDILKLLLNHGADPNLVGSDGEIALHKSLRKKPAEQLVTLLLEANANPNVMNIEQELPLTIAIKMLDIECTKLLLKYGAQVNVNPYKEEDSSYFKIAISNYISKCLNGTDYEILLSFKILESILQAYVEQNIIFMDNSSDISNENENRNSDYTWLNNWLELSQYILDSSMKKLLHSFKKKQEELIQKKSRQKFFPASYFDVITPIPLASEITNSSLSSTEYNNNSTSYSLPDPDNTQLTQTSRTYFKSLGYSATDIDKMRKKNIQKNKKSKLTNNSLANFWSKEKFPIPDSITWHSIMFSKQQLQTMSLGENRFFYLDEIALKYDGCPPETLEKFQKMRVAMDGEHIKNLGKKYLFNARINNENSAYTLETNHELKISGQDRILLFPLNADNNQSYTLYVGCKYLSAGLHTTQVEQSLKISTKEIQITLRAPEQNINATLNVESPSSGSLSKK